MMIAISALISAQQLSVVPCFRAVMADTLSVPKENYGKAYESSVF